VTLAFPVNRTDRLAAPADDVTRQICSFCTAELLVAESPRTAQAVTRARARRSPITFRDRPGRLLRTRAGNCQNTVLMPGTCSGILKTWKPAGIRSAAYAPPWTCTT
jgi:hypothetical protein